MLAHHGMEIDRLWYGTGCAECSGTGYSGRIGVFEYFRSGKEIEAMIAQDREVSIIKHFLVSKGMRTLMADGLKKVIDGTTTLSEIERAVLG